MKHTGDALRDDLRVTVPADGVDPATLWRLLSTPTEWPRWAPHIRRVTTPADDGTLHVGERVRIDGHGPLHVTAAITHVDPPGRWDFRVALPLGHHLTAAHEVTASPTAVEVRMTLDGPLPSPVGQGLLFAYRPIAHLALRRLVVLAQSTG